MPSTNLIPLHSRPDILPLLEPETLLLYKPPNDDFYLRAKTIQKFKPQDSHHPITLLVTYKNHETQFHEHQTLHAQTNQLYLDIPPKGLEKRLKDMYQQ